MEMPRLLELFSGTKSVGKAFEARGWEVVSVDIDFRTDPTHVADMLEWQCPYAPGHFDHVHASPPCTEYSRAKTTGVRDLTTADLLAGKALFLIMALRPKTFTLENPVGMLRDREFMQGLAEFRQTLCYCKYSDWGYRKATDIWTNMNWRALPMCTAASPCDLREGNMHPKTAQRGPSRPGRREQDHFSRNDLYRIPPALCEEWARAAEVPARCPMVNEVAHEARRGRPELPGEEGPGEGAPAPSPDKAEGAGASHAAGGAQGSEGPSGGLRPPAE